MGLKPVERGLFVERIVIIGAGPAGLTAAFELLRRGAGYEIVILEESAGESHTAEAFRKIGETLADFIWQASEKAL